MTAKYKKYQDKKRLKNQDIDLGDLSRGVDDTDQMLIEDDYF